MTDFDDLQGMDMPTPCDKCGEIFDLNDGVAHDNIIYCESCGNKKNEIAEIEEEIENHEFCIREAKENIEYSEIGIENLKKRLEKLN